MFLKDFRPVSFEQDGKPLILTENGLAIDNGKEIIANTSYNTGDRTSLISIQNNSFLVTDGDINTLFNGDTLTRIELSMDTTLSENILVFAFAEAQKINSMTMIINGWDDTTFNFEASNDLISWDLIDSLLMPKNESVVTFPLFTKDAYKYYRFRTQFIANIKGEFYNIDFNVVDRPRFTININNNEDGVYAFRDSQLVHRDSHKNGIVKFLIDGVEAISFNAQRTYLNADGSVASTGNPGNMHVNGYLSTGNTIFSSGNLTAFDGFVQAKAGKFFDNNANGDGLGEWIDFVIDGRKIYLDGIEYGSGTDNVVIDDITASETTTFSSEKILSLIDDFEKIDSYIGAFTQTNSSLFDKYNDIDILMGKICEGSATSDEILLVDTLDQQLGLLAALDNNVVEYIDLKLGK